MRGARETVRRFAVASGYSAAQFATMIP